MHRCLSVEEIVELIATYASSGRHHRPPASLARTCRSFYEPVCNVTWRRLDSFAPLLRLFVLKRSIGSSTGPVSLEDFTQASVSESWTRFMHHARRVRILAGPWHWHYIAYLKVLHQHRPEKEGPLLPGLRHFTFDYSECAPDNVFPLQVLVHPGLLSLNINCRSRNGDLPSFEFLTDRMPLLRNIDIRILGTSEQVLNTSRSINTLLPNFGNLIYVTYNAKPLPSVVLLHLAQLPRLRNLNISLEGGSCSLLAAQEKDLFPALQKAWLICSVASDITELLHAVRSTKLKGLHLCLYEQPTSAMMSEWISLLARQRHLTQLDIRFRRSVSGWGDDMFDDISDDSPEYQLDDDVFRPLLLLKGITRLILRELPMQLTDQLAHDMATSWPDLRELVLGVNNRVQTTGITLEGLKPFATHTPKLWLLGIAVEMPLATVVPRAAKRRWLSVRRQDAMHFASTSSAMTTDLPPSSPPTSQTPVDADNASQPCCTRLRCLAIGFAPIPNPDLVASFVSQYFPDVRIVTTRISWFIWDEYKQLKRVNKLIRKSGKQRWSDTRDTFPYSWTQLSVYLGFPGRTLHEGDFMVF